MTKTLPPNFYHGIMKYVFYPASIAVIGASSDNEKERNTGWVGRLLQFGYKGEIYPINPKAKEVLGLRTYSSVKEIVCPIDYAIITIPRDLVPGSLAECVAKEIKVVHIYTGGFSETDVKGIKLQKEMESIIENSNTRVIGPNCMGVYCPKGGLTFDNRFPKESGSIAFISQSGLGARRLINGACRRGLRFSKAVSYGNAMDLDITDFLESIVMDSETKLVLIYLEGLTRGQRLLNLLREYNKTKPVVLLKAGLSESGIRAVASHTGTLAGSKEVWKAFIKQTGVISVESFEEACDEVAALETLPSIKGRRVGLLGRGGGLGVIAADMCEREGLKVPRLESETINQLAKIMSFDAGYMMRNPVEIGLGVDGLAKNYVHGLRIVASDPNVDLLITFLGPEDFIPYGIEGWDEDICEALREAKKNVSKPFVVVLLPSESVEVFESTLQIRDRCQKEGILCFTSMDSAFRVVSKLVAYYEFKANR